MSSTERLIESLHDSLGEVGYAPQTPGGMTVSYEALFATNGEYRKKFLCAVTHLPDEVCGVDDLRGHVMRIRKDLGKRFRRGLPLPRQMGTFNVLLARREACEAIGRRNEGLIDTGGLHVNLLLGMVLVDVETGQASSDVTWGLLEDGESFRRIQSVVDEWCRHRRRDLGDGTARRLSVA